MRRRRWSSDRFPMVRIGYWLWKIPPRSILHQGSSLGSSKRRHSHFRQFNIFRLRQAAHGNRSDDAAVFPDRHSPAPAREPGIAKIADVEALLGIARSVADLLGGLAFAGRAVGFIHRDRDGGKRSAVHAREGDQIAMRIADCDD